MNLYDEILLHLNKHDLTIDDIKKVTIENKLGKEIYSIDDFMKFATNKEVELALTSVTSRYFILITRTNNYILEFKTPKHTFIER